MLPVINRNYSPISREDHYNKMQAFIDSCKGLPSGQYEYEHILSDGVYIRKLKLKKNTLIVGAVHKKETAMIILTGSVRVFSEDGLVTLKAGQIKISPIGTQRAGLALEDTTLVTLHRADTTDLKQLIAEIGEGDIDNLSGVNEGRYKLFIGGRKEIDEKIQPDSKDALGNGSVQRLLFD
jgi:hypothetical protein